MKKIILYLALFAFFTSTWALQVNSVKVDLLKGYNQIFETNGDTSYCYMGRLTYHLLAQAKDSIGVDFVIVNQSTQDTLVILEKTGDAGLVRQLNAGDTLKAIYFRTKLKSSTQGTFVAKITTSGEMSGMWKLADSLVKMMSLEQKLTLLYSWTSKLDLAGFGSDNFTLSNGSVMVGWRSADGPNGIRFPVTGPPNDIAIYGSGNPATVFATEAALGCTWDTSLARRVGAAIAREARAMGIYCNLGPMSDLVVNPRWGRAFETMGEDPYMVGKMATHQVMGIQSERVVATPKHFTPYCMEESRMDGQRIIVSERSLRELFCVPFEMTIKEGDARAIMTCYNKVKVPGFTTTDATELGANCDRAATNRHLIMDILRRDWGFNGVIMTDWMGAAGVNEAYTFNTAFDMSMPYGDGIMNAVTNIKNNATGWHVDTMNKKALNITYGKLWAFSGKQITNDNAIKTYPASTILSQAHLDLTLEEARESIVLAKNDSVGGATVLPIDKTKQIKLAIVGPYSNAYRSGGGGSSAVTPDSQITPLQGITAYLAANPNSKITLTTDYNNADAAIVFVGVPKEEEGTDRLDLTLAKTPGDNSQAALVTAVMAKVPRTIVVYTGGSASVAGSWSSAPGVVIAFYPGRNQARAMAEILLGDVNPSGHLCVTFPKTAADLPTYSLVNTEFSYTSADTAHGYFYYEKTGKTPLFWFGHGLSYTSFNYSNIGVRGASTVSAGDRLDVTVTVTNTGAKAGADVLQLYVKPKTAGAVPRRVKDLRGFSRVSLASGVSQTITVTLGPRDFSIYDVNLATKSGSWKVMPGDYDIIVGSTSNPLELVNGNGKCVVTPVTIQ